MRARYTWIPLVNRRSSARCLRNSARAERAGAVLLTAFGYDYVPGNLAGALALQAAGPAATRVRVGYFVRGNTGQGTSAGTRASAVGVLLEPGYAFRGGRIVSERSAAHVTSFEIGGKKREAFSIGSSEHFALPRLRAGADGAPGQSPLTDVDVYLGWFGGATRLVQAVSALAAPLGHLAGVRRVLDGQARRIQRSRAQPSAAKPSARTSSPWRATPTAGSWPQCT